MFNLFPHPQSNHDNSTSDNKPSSIDFDFNASINIRGKGKVLINLIAWLLGSIVVGGSAYGLTNILPDNNLPTVDVNSDNPTELLKQPD